MSPISFYFFFFFLLWLLKVYSFGPVFGARVVFVSDSTGPGNADCTAVGLGTRSR